MARQLELRLRTWGGKRKGAGRPRKDGLRGPGVPHLPRPALAPRFPVHTTWRMRRGVWSLRTRRCFSALSRALLAGGDRFGFRLVHYAVMRDHIHLLVEAEDKRALSRGMKGLGVRIAKALNRVMQRRGNVVPDRYHARILRTPIEVRNVRTYLATNARHHYGVPGPDPFASVTALIAPKTWLLRRLE
jgi:putative transposase